MRGRIRIGRKGRVEDGEPMIWETRDDCSQNTHSRYLLLLHVSRQTHGRAAQEGQTDSRTVRQLPLHAKTHISRDRE